MRRACLTWPKSCPKIRDHFTFIPWNNKASEKGKCRVLNDPINNLKTKLRDKDKRCFLENFLSLSVLQGANYILPLVMGHRHRSQTLMLGPENSGSLPLHRLLFNISIF